MSNIRNLILRRGLLNAYPNLTLPPAARFLSANEIKLINARIVGPAKTHVCDEAALDAATNSPMNQWSNGQESDVNRLAAVLASNLMTAPVFPSGNKRTALLAAARFRLQNGMRLSPHASLAESNDAMVQAHNLRAKGLIDIEEFTVICGRMWIPGRNGDRENVMHGRLNTGSSSTSTAILRLGSYNQTKDQQVVVCFIGGPPNSSIIFDGTVGRSLGEGRMIIVTFNKHRVFVEESPGAFRPGSMRLVFPKKGKVFDTLGLGSHRMGVLFQDEALDYCVICPSGTAGIRMWLQVSEVAEAFNKALRDMK